MCFEMAEDVLSLPNAFVVLIFLTVFLLSYLYFGRRSNLPPGPLALPVIGNALWWKRLKKKGTRQSIALLEASKVYGNIILVNFYGNKMVFLHGYDTIRDAFVKNADVLSDRPSWLERLKVATKEGKGVIWQSGHAWKVLRKFVLHTLRDFGVGKTSLEEKIVQEVDAATEFLNVTDGKPTDIRLLTSMIISNVIHGIVFAKRYDYKDENFHTIIENLDTLFQNGGGMSAEGMLPEVILKHVNRKAYNVHQNRKRVHKWIREFIYEEISNHETSFDNENIRDFIDLYIQAKNQNSDESIFHKGNMFRVILDLFIAGSETTSNTINWCILFMQEYPEVQKKCQKEISEKCGDRVVTWKERSSLPYIEATLFEIQRMANIAPSSLMHTNEVDTTIGGYFIPRRTIVVANLYSANMDPKHWSQPEVFNPERFMDGGKVKTNPALIPFSIGPRVCLGQSLAKMEMFLIFTNLLQRFTFLREDDNVKHSFNCILEQATSSPIPYKTRAEKRS